MGKCVLCLDEVLSIHGYIGLFTEEGLNLKIADILRKYFWQLDTLHNNNNNKICYNCWKTVKVFNDFYERISFAHKFNTDPLPEETQYNKNGDDLGSRKNLTGAFFDAGEIKVEVTELDYLPQIEVFSDPDDILMASKLNDSKGNKEPTVLKNKIKRESPMICESEDSESNLPLANYLSICYKNELCESSTSKIHPTLHSKFRKTERKMVRNCNQSKNNIQFAKSKATDVESHDEKNNGDSIGVYNNKVLYAEDSDTSITETDDSYSVDSQGLDPDLKEQISVVPKVNIIKPSKYKKRPKTLIPPVKLSREEIDRRKAQQNEYDKIISKFFGTFPCSKCDLLVKDFSDMRRHFRFTHKVDSGYITCCGRKFHLRKALAEHVLVHWNPNHFKCGTCERIFQDSRSLEIHEKQHVAPFSLKEKKTYPCEKCSKNFTTKAALEYHSLARHVPKSEFKFNCTVCNKKLPTERKLKDHIKYTHDPENAIICDKCGKQMRTRSNLKKHHQLEHSNEPRPTPIPVQCEICGTWLRHLSGLKQHMKTIHEEAGGEHRCHICNKTSTNARALKRHIYHNHECERKFKCTMCEKAFKRPQDLREHTSTHTGEVLYTCPNCPMTFFSNANMYKHRQRLHRAEWEADRKKPQPPNIMRQAVGATAAMKMRLNHSSNTFFPTNQNLQISTVNSEIHQNSIQ